MLGLIGVFIGVAALRRDYKGPARPPTDLGAFIAPRAVTDRLGQFISPVSLVGAVTDAERARYRAALDDLGFRRRSVTTGTMSHGVGDVRPEQWGATDEGVAGAACRVDPDDPRGSELRCAAARRRTGTGGMYANPFASAPSRFSPGAR